MKYSGQIIEMASADSRMAGAVGGLLELSTCSEDETAIPSVDPRPSFVIYTTENAKGEQQYIASVSHNNLEEVLRYGTTDHLLTGYSHAYQ